MNVLTCSIEYERAKSLARVLNVTRVQGSQDNEKGFYRALHRACDAGINTDGSTIGGKNELFYGIRAYEIARYEGVQHYLYSSVDYPLKDTNRNAKYHWGHNDAKGRVADFILAQGQQGMTSSIIMTGPYMNMAYDGMFVPHEQEDGSIIWANPARKYSHICLSLVFLLIFMYLEVDGKFPLIAVKDMGPYSLWMFDNINESAGLALKIATDEISFADIATTFTQATGKKAIHRCVALKRYFPTAEPYPNAPANKCLPSTPMKRGARQT